MIEFDETDLDHYDGKRYSKAKGVEVLTIDGKTVQIWQINSKGEESRCYITVPRDKINGLIAELQQMRDKLS